MLVMADSDAFVGPDYLATVTAPLLDARVGLVTCAYRGVPTRGVWSRLGAMYINEWYMPSVLLAWLFGYEGYVSGQTMCLRHETLRAIGGLRTIADHLADDHRLGELIRGLGLRIVLSPYVVGGEHHEQNMRSLTRHELRWMRTIHVLRPVSFRMIFLSFSLPLAVFGMIARVRWPVRRRCRPGRCSVSRHSSAWRCISSTGWRRNAACVLGSRGSCPCATCCCAVSGSAVSLPRA